MCSSDLDGASGILFFTFYFQGKKQNCIICCKDEEHCNSVKNGYCDFIDDQQVCGACSLAIPTALIASLLIVLLQLHF